MNERKRATIQALFAVEYGNMLKRVRSAEKGLRIQYLFAINILGGYNEGLRLCEAREITGKSDQNIFKQFRLGIERGYIYKSNKRYYLTDAGRNVYVSMCKEFDTSMKAIIAALVEEAKKHL